MPQVTTASYLCWEARASVASAAKTTGLRQANVVGVDEPDAARGAEADGARLARLGLRAGGPRVDPPLRGDAPRPPQRAPAQDGGNLHHAALLAHSERRLPCLRPDDHHHGGGDTRR